jgi:hypothetical protein
VAGIQLIHDFLRWEPKINLKAKGEIYDLDLAQRIYRLHGPLALEEYKKQFYDEAAEENIPMLQIFDTCKILIDTIPMCIYDDKKVEDIAEFEGDDPVDDLRYFCKAARRFMLGEVGNLTLAAKKQQAIDDLNVTGDMTSFYRRMEMIERQDLATLGDSIPISRRSRFARRRH